MTMDFTPRIAVGKHDVIFALLPLRIVTDRLEQIILL